MQPVLSLVIPAYNEAQRLPPYLAAIRAHFERALPGQYEIIVVDDGSQDGLGALLEDLAADWSELNWLYLQQNQGKGASVRTGVLAAHGELILFADADGATPIEEETKLRLAIEQGADVAIGSRLALGEGVTRSRARGLSGRVFAWSARRVFRLSVLDTQCGFKMFRRETGLRLFQLCEEKGFLFDLEVLAWAQRLGCRIAERPVRWTDVPGSKVRVLRDGWRMFRGLWRLRRSLEKRDRALQRRPAPLATARSPVNALLS